MMAIICKRCGQGPVYAEYAEGEVDAPFVCHNCGYSGDESSDIAEEIEMENET